MDDHHLEALLGRCPPGPFRVADASSFGLSRKHVSTLVMTGLLTRPLFGVLVRRDVPDSLEHRASVVRLVLPAGAALCRTTAAWLMGVDCRPPGEHAAVPPVDCVVPVPRRRLRHPGVRCFEADLPADDVVELAGLPVTSPQRTAVDLARYSIPGYGLGALDAMARKDLVDPAELLEFVERWRGGRFVDRARRLIAVCDPLSESFGESCLRLRVIEAGFPVPALQIPLVDADGVLWFRLDMGWDEVRYSLEYDGERFHLGLDSAAHDRRRRDQIQARWGWTVVGVGKALVLGPRMDIEFALGEIFSMEPAIRRRAW